MKKEFFDHVRQSVFGGKLLTKQVEGLNHITQAFLDSGLTDLRWLAYMMATAFHETAGTMQPIEEYGKGKGRDYGKKLKMSRLPYPQPNQLYYGRGYVQITWFENYDKLGKLLKVDLLNNPALALQPAIAAQIMIVGMTRGLFTGASLSRYFNSNLTDWVNARKIINGLDCASKIAVYAKHFHTALLK